MGLLTLPWKKQAKFVQNVALFCVNEQFSDELFAFIDAKAPGFAGEAHDAEYKLTDSAVHAEFTQTFESRIEAFIAGQGYTAADFYRLLKKADDAGEETVTGFVKTLLPVVLLQRTFVDWKRRAAQPWPGFSFPRIALHFHDRTVFEFDVFVSLCRDEGKRGYLKQIMSGWRATLTKKK